MDGSQSHSTASPDQSRGNFAKMRSESHTTLSSVLSMSAHNSLKARFVRQGARVTRSAGELAAEAERVIVRDSIVRTRSLPWESETGEHTWGALRVMLAKVLMSYQIEILVICIIGFNVWLILYETNEEAKCYPQFTTHLEDCPTASSKSVFSDIANKSLLIIYSVEVAVGIFVLRREYFKAKTHQFDFVISVCGWCALVAGGLIKVSWIRCFRIARIMKTLRFVYSIPECYMLFSGFAGSMRAMFFGAIVLAVLLCLFSILTVQLIHPISAGITYPDCPLCAQGFQSVGEAMLTIFQQSVAGDSWGLINIPILKESWVGMILPVTHLVIGVGAMNLILAVVVDRAVEARENDREQAAAIRSEMQKTRKLDLLKLFRDFDTDENGTIGRDEITNATRSSLELKHRLLVMGMSADELGEIFDALQDDSFDGEGAGYLKLCTAFDDLQAADIRKTVVLTKLHLAHMQRRVLRRLDRQSAMLEGMSMELASLRKSKDASPIPNNKNPRPSCEPSALATRSDPLILTDSCDGHIKSLPVAKVSSLVANPQIPDVPFSHSPNSSHSLEFQTAREITQLRQCLAQLDSSWSHALHIAQNVSLMCLDASLPNSEEVDTMHTLCRHLLLKSGHRGSRFVENLSRDLEDDVTTLVRQLRSRIPHSQDSVSMSVNHSQTVCSMPKSLRQPRSPRTPSPSVPERRCPQTPPAHDNRVDGVGKVNVSTS